MPVQCCSNYQLYSVSWPESLTAKRCYTPKMEWNSLVHETQILFLSQSTNSFNFNPSMIYAVIFGQFSTKEIYIFYQVITCHWGNTLSWTSLPQGMNQHFCLHINRRFCFKFPHPLIVLDLRLLTRYILQLFQQHHVTPYRCQTLVLSPILNYSQTVWPIPISFFSVRNTYNSPPTPLAHSNEY